MKPPSKGIFASCCQPKLRLSRELLPACWPEPPPAGWSCSGSVDEAAVSPQAVGHDQPSPRHRLATALWAGTSSSMNAEIHCPRLEEKIAAQDSPSNPSSTAPRGADSRPWTENPKYLGDQNLKVFGLLYTRLETALFSPVKSHAGTCTCSGGHGDESFVLRSYFERILGCFLMVAFCLVGSCYQASRESRKRFSVHKHHVRMSPYSLSLHARLILRQSRPTICQRRNLALRWGGLSSDLYDTRD